MHGQQTIAATKPTASEPAFVDALVHPGVVFGHPSEVAEHPRFSHQEKRAILLSWVRDELLIEEVASRALPELRRESRIDAVVDALRRFDPLAAKEYASALALLRDRPKKQSRLR
jgi:hypothetical protein